MKYRIRTLSGITKVEDDDTDSWADAIEYAQAHRVRHPQGEITIVSGESPHRHYRTWWPGEEVNDEVEGSKDS